MECIRKVQILHEWYTIIFLIYLDTQLSLLTLTVIVKVIYIGYNAFSADLGRVVIASFS